MKLTFWGAARQVSGSMFLLELGSKETFDEYNILIDCGTDLEHDDKKLVEEFSKVKGKKTLPYNAESDLTDYLQLYNDLASK